MLNGIFNTINPKKGDGVQETIIVLTVIVSIVFLTYFNKDVPKELLVFLTSIGSLFVGRQIGKNEKKDGEEIEIDE